MLSACGRQINTACIERLNWDIHQHVAAVGRRVNTLCKGQDSLQQQVVLHTDIRPGRLGRLSHQGLLVYPRPRGVASPALGTGATTSGLTPVPPSSKA
jgi:hypothetical protein